MSPRCQWYFQQYDVVWSLTTKQAQKLVAQYLSTGDYNLDKIGRRIKLRTDIEYEINRPLNWYRDDWLNCQRNLQAAVDSLKTIDQVLQESSQEFVNGFQEE